MSKLCVSALICFRVFYEASRTSTRNHPHDPTTSKPVVPGGLYEHEYSLATEPRAALAVPKNPIRAAETAIRLPHLTFDGTH